MAFTLVPVVADYQRPNGAPESGEVEFELSDALLNAVGAQITAPTKVLATLNAAGAISLNLVAVDDPTTSPVGSVYHVTERFSLGRVNEYDMLVPYDTVGTLDLAEAAHITTTTRSVIVDGGTP